MSGFTGATLMITGGTGSFGNTVLKHFLTSDIGEIRIFSRDEKQQDDTENEGSHQYCLACVELGGVLTEVYLFDIDIA